MKSTYIVLGIVLVAAVVGGSFLINGKKTAKKAPQNAPVSNETSMKDKQTEEVMMGSGYILKNGKMMIEENHAFRAMTEEVTLKDGTIVSILGEVTKKDGTKFSLTEGQSMWTDGSFVKEEAMKKDVSASGASSLSTRYIDYSSEALAKATENNGKAVIWFAALKWCPSCQAADRDFRANFDKVPKDVSIMKIDYDTATDLKKKYAIVMQDTFIYVDSKGKEITRWNSGGQGVASVLANVK